MKKLLCTLLSLSMLLTCVLPAAAAETQAAEETTAAQPAETTATVPQEAVLETTHPAETAATVPQETTPEEAQPAETAATVPQETVPESTGETVVSLWSWVDPDESVEAGIITLYGIGPENPLDFESVCTMLPQMILADGEEISVFWQCETYIAGAQGDFIFTAQLPDGYLLAEAAPALTITVRIPESSEPMEESLGSDTEPDLLAAPEAALNEQNFPDANFREFLSKNYDLDHDQQLSATELEAITVFSFNHEHGFQDLTGINLLQNLHTIELDNLDIPNLNISGLNQLESLTVKNCSKMTELIAWGADSLQRLECRNLNAGYFRNGTLPQLREVIFDHTAFLGLGLKDHKNLQKVSCTNGRLQSASLSGCTALQHVDLSRNCVDYVGLQDCTALTYLNVAHNKLYKLDIGWCSELQYLYFNDNHLCYLNGDNNKKLIVCQGGENYSLVSKPFMNFDNFAWQMDHFRVLVLDGGEKTEYGYNITGGCMRYTYKLNENFFPEYNLVYWDTEKTYPHASTLFPDPVLCQYVLDKVDWFQDGELSPQELSVVTELHLDKLGIENLEGIQLFSNLETLSLNQNQVSSLDTSAFKKLHYLYCSDNQIENLDLSKNTELIEISCSDNPLLCLNLQNNHALKKVEADGCGRSLAAGDVRFDFRTVPGFNLKKASGWYGCSVDNTGILTVLNPGAPVTYRYDTGWGDPVAFTLTTFPMDVPLTETFFPDPGFRQYLSSFDKDKDQILSGAEIAQITAMEMNGSNMTGTPVYSLEGIGCLGMLNSLTLEFMPITSLDLSHNIMLETLNVSNTGLRALEIRPLRNLHNLLVFNTELSSFILPENVFLYYRSISGNLHHCVLKDGHLDLKTLKDFDYRKASDWTGASVDGNGIMTPDAETHVIRYTYECGTDEFGNVITGEFGFLIEDALKQGWQEDSRGKKYVTEDGSFAQAQFLKIDGVWYYFDYDGYMKTGWLKLDGKTYYFSSTGHMLTGWQHIGEKDYYFLQNGSMAVSTWIGNFYVGADGAWERVPSVGRWRKEGSRWWYQNPDGSYPKNNFQKIGSYWFYFDASGYMVTGWRQVAGKWYYFDGSGRMLTGWRKLGSFWYHFDGSGAMSLGWKEVGSSWYYFDGSGHMFTGWLTYKGNSFYFDGSGAMCRYWKTISGKNYYFYSDGSLAKDAWIGNYYVDPEGIWIPDAVKPHWKQIGSSWKYIHTDGSYTLNDFEKIHGDWYYFDRDGFMLTGLQMIEDIPYYFEASGRMARGWKQLNGSWYYFTGSGAGATSWQKIGSHYYFFDAEGPMQTGWLQVGNKKYYLGEDGAMITGWYKLQYDQYYFGADGVMATGVHIIDDLDYDFGTDGILDRKPVKETVDTCIGPMTVYLNHEFAKEVFRLTNEFRVANGRAPLKWSRKLELPAKIRAAELTESYSHTRPDNTPFYTVSEYAFSENIASNLTGLGVNAQPEDIVNGWINSPGHCANMLDPRHKTMAAGCVQIYVSNSGWVQLFGQE